MEAWLANNWQLVSMTIAGVVLLFGTLIYALRMMITEVTTVTSSMASEVKSALGTATNDRKLELSFLQQYLDDNRQTRQALMEAQVEIRTLTKQVQDYAGEVANLKLQVATGRSEADEALMALNNARTQYIDEKQVLMQQVADLTEEVKKLKGRVQTLEETARLKQAALDEVTAQRDELLERVATLERKNKDLLNEREELQQQVADIRKELDALKTQIKEKDEGGNDDTQA